MSRSRTLLPLAALPAAALVSVAGVFAVLGAGRAGAELGAGALTGLHRYGPTLLAEEVEPPGSPIERVRLRGQLLDNVRLATFGTVKPHPLIEEAGEILTRRLRPHASGLYVTSLTRTPEDQRRLMRAQHTRGWAIHRSKHLMGMAIDIGFVTRQVSTWKLRDHAEAILVEELGEEAAGMLRVVREKRCIHVEIDTWKGRELLRERVELLEALGVLKRSPEDNYPVPRLRDYVTEEQWTQVRGRVTVALPF